MIEWLEDNVSNEEGKKAQERWNSLQCKLKWNNRKHRRALKLLKELRNDDAHPSNVDVEARRQLIEGEYFTRWEQKSCMEIIGMIEIARNLNTIQSNLYPCNL